MSRSGNILRLIDIVLILLFGFISISEVSQRSRIDLAKSTETPLTAPDPETILVVGVAPDGTFLVGNESFVIRTPRELREYLRKEQEEARRKKKVLRVRVRPNWNTPVQHAMVVAAICDQLNLPKGMDVRRITRREGI